MARLNEWFKSHASTINNVVQETTYHQLHAIMHAELISPTSTEMESSK